MRDKWCSVQIQFQLLPGTEVDRRGIRACSTRTYARQLKGSILRLVAAPLPHSFPSKPFQFDPITMGVQLHLLGLYIEHGLLRVAAPLKSRHTPPGTQSLAGMVVPPWISQQTATALSESPHSIPDGLVPRRTEALTRFHRTCVFTKLRLC